MMRPSATTVRKGDSLPAIPAMLFVLHTRYRLSSFLSLVSCNKRQWLRRRVRCHPLRSRLFLWKMPVTTDLGLLIDRVGLRSDYFSMCPELCPVVTKFIAQSWNSFRIQWWARLFYCLIQYINQFLTVTINIPFNYALLLVFISKHRIST